MGLGQPLRVTLATGSGAAVIQTATVAEQHSSSSTGSTDEGDDYHRHRPTAPVSTAGEMLVGTVIAPADMLAEARMASWGIEEVARRFQKSAGEGL